jgi:hypothetical protein
MRKGGVVVRMHVKVVWTVQDEHVISRMKSGLVDQS